MAQTGVVQLASIVQDRISIHPQQQQQRHNIAVPGRSRPNLPHRYLFMADAREKYRKVAVPLYEASIKCNWNTIKDILYTRPELTRYSITENGETMLHVAASSKCDPKAVVGFIKNLVGMMREEDLLLENENFNTAIYLAAAAGNVEAVKIMAEKNKILLTIPGAGQRMLPLYAAALFGNYEVVKYLYEESKDLGDDCWNPENRGWLLEKCVENDMFDMAIKIVKKYQELGRSGSALRILARKPEAFHETKPNIMWTTLKSVFASMGLTVGGYEKENQASQLLRIIWKDITERPKREIDSILRGPPDDSGNLIHVSPVVELIFKLLGKLDVETKIIMGGPSDVTKHNKALKLQELMSEHLVNMDVETRKLIKHDNKRSFGSRYKTLDFQLQKIVYNHVVNIRVEFQNIIKQVSEGDQKDQARYLKELILKHIAKLHSLTRLIIGQHSSRILFIAAEMGNTKFLVELIREYPDLIWKVDDDNHSIFHIAVKYRHKGIYSLLYEIGSMKDLITPLKDTDDNNMLHLVGKVTTKRGEAVVSGPVLQMQREVLWFMDVRNMIPPSYRERLNKDGLTPTDLFLNEHKDLIKEGEKWMKDTANQSMVAATLIATIAFAAAFTIPGGYNQDNGIPIFYRKPLFAAFLVVDAMSLFLSSTSILSLLSLFTSRYTEFDFVKSLPKKLILGMSTLFASIIAMIITFTLGLFMLCHKEMMWIPILFGVIALIPILLYCMLQYHMFMDVIRSTFSSRYYFEPKKQSLYNVNPAV